MFFVFFLSHAVLVVAVQPYLVLLCVPFACAYPLWKEGMGFLSLSYFCIFMGLWASLLPFPIGLAHWVLFLSFISGFFDRWFFLALLLSLLGLGGLPASVSYWAGPLGLFLSSFQAFVAHLLLSCLLSFLFARHWVFLLLSLFYLKRVSIIVSLWIPGNTPTHKTLLLYARLII